MSVLLSEHLPLLATAPDGIQKLRGLILELAVRGKLVPQDSNDEPASELLKRIAKERARLEAEGTCRKSKAMPLSGEEDGPFEVPAGWKWVRLAEIGHDWGHKTPDSDFTYVDVSAIDNARGTVNCPTVVAPADAPSRARKVVRRGTVIYSTVRPYLLNIAVIDRDLTPAPIASTAFAIVHPLAGLSSQFIFWYLRSPVFVRYVESVQTGIAYPAVNDSQFFSGLFPLPPLAEQHRIVAKVDELMDLCDRLEAEQTDSEAAHAKLVDTLLGTLTQSTDAAELAALWQRLAEHFDALFTTESSLDALKQTILQLAVMGKLVPQDPADEPASELLKRIAKERARLEAEGTCKKSKAAPLVGGDDLPFALPGGWSCVHFDEIVNPEKPISYGVLVPGPDVSDGVPFVRIADLSIANPPALPEKTIDRSVDTQFARTRLDGGEVLMGVVGSIGKLGVAPMSWKGANIARAICRIVPTPHFDKSFLVLLLQSKVMQMAFTGDTRTLAQPTLNVGLIRTAHTPIPPLAEQHRIVAKVDELMALCDRLKADLAESRTRQARLSATLIESALQAA